MMSTQVNRKGELNCVFYCDLWIVFSLAALYRSFCRLTFTDTQRFLR